MYTPFLVNWLSSAGSSIDLKANAARVLQRADEDGMAVHVISVNWSTALIDAALKQHQAGLQGRVCIQANELELRDGNSTGRILRYTNCSSGNVLKMAYRTKTEAQS